VHPYSEVASWASGGSREIEGTLVGRKCGGYAVMDFLHQGFALIEGIKVGVHGIEEFHDDFARMDDEFAFLHDAMRAGAGYGNDRNSGFDGHDCGPLLEVLQATIGAASTFGVDKERLAVAQGVDGLVYAFDGGLAIETVDRNEMSQVEGLADNGPVEQRAFEENGDAAWDGADYGGGVSGTGVIRGENAGSGRDAFRAFHLDMDSGTVDEEHHAFQAGPVEWVDMFCEESVDEQRRADDQDIEANENGNESSTEHGLIRFL
jgi:hypothetical protein